MKLPDQTKRKFKPSSYWLMQPEACVTEGPSTPGNDGTRSQPKCDIIINIYWFLPPSSWHGLLNPVMSQGQGDRSSFVIPNEPLSTLPEFMPMK